VEKDFKEGKKELVRKEVGKAVNLGGSKSKATHQMSSRKGEGEREVRVNMREAHWWAETALL